MGKILIFLYQNMADFEMTFAATTMNWIEKEVITISNTKDAIKAYSGIIYQPELTVKDALDLGDVDGLIIPGGYDLDFSEELQVLIERLNEEEKLLSAICAGPQYLAKAGVLSDVKFTTTLSKVELDKNNKADYFTWDNFVKENVVRDRNIITALGNAFIDFAMEIIDFFKGFQSDEQKEKYKNHYKGL